MSTAAPARTDTVMIEWAPFRPAEGVDEAALLRASEALQEGFLARQPGFLRRELLRASDGRWVDLVYWQSEESAAAAMKVAMESPACHEYFRLMNADGADPGAGVEHYRRVTTYE